MSGSGIQLSNMEYSLIICYTYYIFNKTKNYFIAMAAFSEQQIKCKIIVSSSNNKTSVKVQEKKEECSP